MAHSSLRAAQLLELVAAYLKTGSARAVWSSTALPGSLSTVSRWLRRWRRSASHIRSHLFQIHPPPEDAAMSTSQFTWNYLREAFQHRPCPARAFQLRFQRSFIL